MELQGSAIVGECYRITVLEDRLIRLEYSKEGQFTDEKTINVIDRHFPKTMVMVTEKEGIIHIDNDILSIKYNGESYTASGLSITLNNGYVWNYGDNYIDETGNLLGTARTLDNADGAVEMSKGIFSRKGIVLLDDSKTPLLINNEVYDRAEGLTDVYIFCYGEDFSAGLKAFSKLTGKTPMIPRYALGNWWSKYEKYTQESYIELLDNFEAENVPLSVGVIDMDWHITDIDSKYGSGWTGFTWNKELFPDYKKFLSDLHERGLAVTLNLHPADGIRASEDMYENVALALGIDPKKEEAIAFDLADKKFREAYFEEVIRPYEEDGVDFWWIDWQQGTQMGKSQVDPLWLNNHYHYVDQDERQKRAMIFSRYVGWGSHRYPIGFSGDTKTTWRSLAFQPWFTATASNIGYGWWSHDIGGHMLGDRDDERLVRWIQFGVFSPIMRLHSSNSPFFVKEPWNQREPYRSIIDNYMRLRHRLIPYLYTMNYLTWRDDMPLIRPMYYENSADRRSYDVGNEYMFGDSLIVGTITKPVDEHLKMASTSMYLPAGAFYDLFSGRRYEGGIKRNMYRSISDIPVLLPEGKILPLAGENCLEANTNPEQIDLYLVWGKNASGMLYEDDGNSTDYRLGVASITKFTCSCSADSMTINIANSNGNTDFIPDNRKYVIHIYGVESAEGSVMDSEKNAATIDLGVLGKTNAEMTITGIKAAKRDYVKDVFNILVDSWIENITKEKINHILQTLEREEFIVALSEMDVDATLKDAIMEVLAG